MLSQELLKELREIVKEGLGEELNENDLFEFGENLISYFELLAKIYAREHLENKVEFDSLIK
jgi:hypothetical protein